MTQSFYSPAFSTPALALLLGVMLGILYDMFRLIRLFRSSEYTVSKKYADFLRGNSEASGIRKSKIKKTFLNFSDNVLTFAEDILFWVIAAFSEIIFLYLRNSGQFRIFLLIFTSVGFVVYYLSIGRAVRFFGGYIIYTLKILLLRFVINPTISILKLFKNILGKAYASTLGVVVSCINRRYRMARSDILCEIIINDSTIGFARLYNERIKNNNVGNEEKNKKKRRPDV